MRHLALAGIALTAALLLAKKTGYKFSDGGAVLNKQGKSRAEKKKEYIKCLVPFLFGVFLGELFEFFMTI